MTLIETPVAEDRVDPMQLLFEEARRRRKRRRLIAGVVSALAVLIVGAILALTSGDGRTSTPPRSSSPPIATAPALSAAAFSVRPLLCFAPEADPGLSASPGATPLPPCSEASALTATHVALAPTDGGGYSMHYDLGPDAQFVAFPSTTWTDDVAGANVIVPGSGNGHIRYVLGPASLVAADVKSAAARPTTFGMGVVILHLTTSGAAKWDALARQQLHAMVGVVFHNALISAPIIQPSLTSSSYVLERFGLLVVGGDPVG